MEITIEQYPRRLTLVCRSDLNKVMTIEVDIKFRLGVHNKNYIARIMSGGVGNVIEEKEFEAFLDAELDMLGPLLESIELAFSEKYGDTPTGEFTGVLENVVEILSTKPPRRIYDGTFHGLAGAKEILGSEVTVYEIDLPDKLKLVNQTPYNIEVDGFEVLAACENPYGYLIMPEDVSKWLTRSELAFVVGRGSEGTLRLFTF